MVFRLRIVRADGASVGLGQAFGRYLATILSRLILYIGYLMIAFREDKRGLHDLIAETKVIYAPPVRR